MTPTNTERIAFQLLAAANYIDALGGDSASYRQAIAAHDAEQAAQAVPEVHCNYCGGSGDVCTPTGEWRGECDQCPAAALHSFKNFHRLLCERFGYSHDEKDWRRDQLSLIEFIAAKVKAAQAVPAGLYVGLIERLMRLSTRLGIAHDDSVEHFAASLEDRLYAICRSAESLLDSLAPAAPAPEAQAAGQDERAAFGAWFQGFRHGWKSEKDVAFDAWQARAALAQRQPLTDEQIESIRAQVFAKALQRCDGCDHETWDHWFARAIEAAHGIGATTGEQR